MIFTERTITVVNDSATINKPLILYRGDKNIELKITIAESQFKFRNTDASNVIETTDASYAQLVINTPYNSPIFSDVAVTKNGAVIFVITEAMIDEIREVGAYEIQIRLLDDNKQSRASIPPVSNAIEIREPIAIEDGSAVDSNAVNTARVNRALTTTSAPLEAFDSQGNYIKKTWGDGDPITDAALNKMEAAIDGVNKKIGNNRSQIKEKADQAELIDARIGITGYTYDNLGNAVRDQLLRNIPQYIQLPYTYGTSSYIKHADGTLVAGSEKYKYTDFIELLASTKVYLKDVIYKGKDYGGLAFYNAEQGYISGYQYDNLTGAIIELDVPKGAKYVRFCFKNEVLNYPIIYQSYKDINANINSSINAINDVIGITEEPINFMQMFHKIAIVGDSLASGEIGYYDESTATNKYVDCYKYSWLSNICKNIGATAVHYSAGGRTTKSFITSSDFSKISTESPLPSAYYIALGTNDVVKVPLGTIDDCDTENETFYGMYSKIINALKTANPNAAIFCVSAYLPSTKENVPLFNNAISEMCTRYNCYFIDFYNNYSHLYSHNPLYVNLAHFTTYGYIRVADQIMALTNEVIKANLSNFKFLALDYKNI